LLLHGIDPDSEKGELLKKLLKSNIKPRPKIAREVKATFNKVDSTIRGGKLSYHSGSGVELEPLVFLQWAKSKGFVLPEKLDNVLSLYSENTKPQLEKPLSTRERRTFLVIIAAALKEAEIDITHPEKAAQTVAEITERMGTPIDHQTIVNKLKEIPDVLESRRK
jgi:hypothetical protein